MEISIFPARGQKRSGATGRTDPGKHGARRGSALSTEALSRIRRANIWAGNAGGGKLRSCVGVREGF